jgi:restriction endonuclease S subunit
MFIFITVATILNTKRGILETVTLEKIATINVGYQTRSRIKERPDGIYRIIQGRNIDENNELQENKIVFFKPDRNPEQYQVKKNDILFQSRGIKHYACCIHTELKKTLVANSFYIIRIHEKKIIPAYLCWWLNQQPAQNYFQSQASATVISFISKSVLMQIRILIPEIDIQKKIISTIGLWKREKKLYKNLEERRAKLIETICMKAILK